MGFQLHEEIDSRNEFVNVVVEGQFVMSEPGEPEVVAATNPVNANIACARTTAVIADRAAFPIVLHAYECPIRIGSDIHQQACGLNLCFLRCGLKSMLNEPGGLDMAKAGGKKFTDDIDMTMAGGMHEGSELSVVLDRNVGLALQDGPDPVQIALDGCFMELLLLGVCQVCAHGFSILPAFCLHPREESS